ncbi:MAG TPA: glycine zipper domain-containing protein [Planctomycetaceae bacterium]|nr:glycine zipper domain-containing protein [Planctomycetaceae bacterium]
MIARAKSRWLLVLSVGLFAAGCHPRNHTEHGVMLGSTLGALAGGVIGHQSGNTVDGAALGAVAGGLTGAIVGNANDERDMALASASASQVKAENAVTNYDLIRMTQSGVSDEVIVNTVRSRGGRIDLGPSAIIDLKNNGVSDAVILGIQQAAEAERSGQMIQAVSSRPNIVVVPPAYVGVGVHTHRHPHYYRPRPYPRTGLSLHYSR